MRAKKCTSCGASEFVQEGSSLRCAYCGTAYASEANSVIALNDDVARLLDKCRREPHKARRYANLILDIDPTNMEALRYL